VTEGLCSTPSEFFSNNFIPSLNRLIKESRLQLCLSTRNLLLCSLNLRRIILYHKSKVHVKHYVHINVLSLLCQRSGPTTRRSKMLCTTSSSFTKDLFVTRRPILHLITVNAFPNETPKYCIDDVIDFLDNLYDVVFMTYEANITTYGA